MHQIGANLCAGWHLSAHWLRYGAMKDILEKISSYSLFDYLFPGVIFSVLEQRFNIIALPKADVIGSGAGSWFLKRLVA